MNQRGPATRERTSRRQSTARTVVSQRRSRLAELALEVPKVPRLFQERLDELIDKSKLGRLSPDEDRQLRGAIEYLDQLKVYAMSRVLHPRPRRRTAAE